MRRRLKKLKRQTKRTGSPIVITDSFCGHCNS